MYFTKPKMKITEMCRYIDELKDLTNLDEVEQNNVFTYLYFIVFSICNRRKYFSSERDCSEFAIHLAENLYYRLINPELERLKNVLDYIKKILSGRIITWQNKDKFSEVVEDIYDDENNVVNFAGSEVKQMWKSSIEDCDREKVKTLVLNEIKDLPRLIRDVCQHTQFRNDKVLTERFYMSCLLSFLNWITLPNETQQFLDTRKDTLKYKSILTKNRFKNFDDDVILWHLPNDYSDMVKVLLNRIKTMFINNIYAIKNKFELSNDVLDYMTSIELLKEGGVYYG